MHKNQHMVAILGTYENGRVTFEEEINVPKKGKVIVTFLEEEGPETAKVLTLANFSFAKTRALLKDVKVSFSEVVVNERRKAV